MDQKKQHERIPQLQEIKREGIPKLDLPGIKIVGLDVNTSKDPLAITFQADDGRVLKVTGYSTYEARIRLFTNKPPEIVTTYQLTGELGPDVHHDGTFTSLEDAERRMVQLTRDFQNAKDLKIDEKRVEV